VRTSRSRSRPSAKNQERRLIAGSRDTVAAASPFIAVGRIAGPFGVHGEIKVDALTDFPERFDPGSELFLDGVPVTVVSGKSSGADRFVVRLREVNGRAEAETLRGLSLDIREDALTKLPEGSYYRFQLMGLTAVTDAGVALGTVTEIIETGGSDVLVIRSEQGREALVPNVAGFADPNISEGKIVIHPILGLLAGLDEQTGDSLTVGR
jgi:16S rRNA processing protein RimM